jgi:dipeptidyl aminopeptidase/acylaminoacyl peptidase
VATFADATGVKRDPQLADPPFRSTISVADMVRFASIGDPETLMEDYQPPRETGVFSPDGRRVAVLVRNGNPDSGTNDATLTIYRTSELLEAGRPEIVAQFASRENRQPIARIRWLSDSTSLVFAGASGSDTTQIFRVDTRSKNLEQLTHVSEQLTWYDIDGAGKRIVMLARPRANPPANDPACLARACRITASALYYAEEGIVSGSVPLLVKDPSGSVRTLDAPETRISSLRDCTAQEFVSLSPDGGSVLRLCTLKDVPASWSEYQVSPRLSSCMERGGDCGLKYVLTDLNTGTSALIESGPLVYAGAKPIWLNGGRDILFVNALQGLDEGEQPERLRRATTLPVLLVNTGTREIQRVASLDPGVALVRDAKWDETRGILHLTVEDRQRVRSSKCLKRRAASWSFVSQCPGKNGRVARAGEVQLMLQQSLNDRPILVAVQGSRRRVLLDPNPWLAERHVGRVEAITWTTKDGRVWRGGLYYPPSYTPGVRYPLMIQTHGFDPERFSLPGIGRNFTGQALSAHGIIVLQVAERFDAALGYVAEWATVRAGHEGAIDHLAARGLIDPSRVGIQGWSRTGPHTGYMLTQSSYPFAAAAFTSTADIGWLWYIAMGAPRSVDALYGAAPFGEGLKEWAKYVPTFNLDRVSAPVLMLGEGTGRGMWDWYAGLARWGKPVEYWIQPDGVHDVYKVDQRLHHNQLLVDWFRFWLKDEEDADASKAEQYSRWREYRRQLEVGGS